MQKNGGGVKKQMPHVGDAGRGINRQMPHVGDGSTGINRCGFIHEYMSDLAVRLRNVRVCCGDWSGVLGYSVTVRHGITGVFLDPPYAIGERTNNCYAVDTDCSKDVIAWAIANGDNPLFRIAYCGYEDAGFPTGWECYAWKAAGGYGSQGDGRGRTNAHRERIWFSPHCLKVDRPKQISLNDLMEAEDDE